MSICSGEIGCPAISLLWKMQLSSNDDADKLIIFLDHDFQI